MPFGPVRRNASRLYKTRPVDLGQVTGKCKVLNRRKRRLSRQRLRYLQSPAGLNSPVAGILLLRQAQESVLEGLVAFEDAGESRGDGRDMLVVHAARGHALMFGIDQDGDAQGRQ